VPTPSPNPNPDDPLELTPQPAPPRSQSQNPFITPHKKNKHDSSGWDDTPDGGGPTCSYCSYSLAGQGITGKCPECGFRFDLAKPKPKSAKLRRKSHEFLGFKGRSAIAIKFAILTLIVLLTWTFHNLIPHSTLTGDWVLWGNYAGAAVWSFMVIWASTLAWWILDFIEEKERLPNWTVYLTAPALCVAVTFFLWPKSILPTLAIGAVMGLLRVAKVRIKPYIPIKFRCEVCEFPLDGAKPKGDCPKCTAPYDLIRAQQERDRGEDKIRHMYCRNCEYELTGLPRKSSCPECGHPFDLMDPSTRISIVQLANRRQKTKYLVSQLIASLILLVSGNYLLYAACSITSSATNPGAGLSIAGLLAIALPLIYATFVTMADRILCQPLGMGFWGTMFVCTATPLLISTAALASHSAHAILLLPLALFSGFFAGIFCARRQLGDIRQ
jgi:rubrerythrin